MPKLFSFIKWSAVGIDVIDRKLVLSATGFVLFGGEEISSTDPFFKFVVRGSSGGLLIKTCRGFKMSSSA